jgi:hypothetical protein
MACDAIPEPFPAFNADPRSRVIHEKRELGLSEFLKNNTDSSRLGKKLSIFLNQASRPRPAAFAAPRETPSDLINPIPHHTKSD